MNSLEQFRYKRFLEVKLYYTALHLYNICKDLIKVQSFIEGLSDMGQYDEDVITHSITSLLSDGRYKPSLCETVSLCHTQGLPVRKTCRFLHISPNRYYSQIQLFEDRQFVFLPKLNAEVHPEIEKFLIIYKKIGEKILEQ